MLRNVPQRDLTTSVLGHKVKLPIGISPTGFQKLAHPDGEIAAAKGRNKKHALVCSMKVNGDSDLI